MENKEKQIEINTPTVQCEAYSQNDLVVISKEELEVLYERLQQASKKTTEKFYNTIVYRILALNFETDNKNYDEGFFDAIKEVLRRIDNVAKQFEVEIKE